MLGLGRRHRIRMHQTPLLTQLISDNKCGVFAGTPPRSIGTHTSPSPESVCIELRCQQQTLAYAEERIGIRKMLRIRLTIAIAFRTPAQQCVCVCVCVLSRCRYGCWHLHMECMLNICRTQMPRIRSACTHCITHSTHTHVVETFYCTHAPVARWGCNVVIYARVVLSLCLVLVHVRVLAGTFRPA